MVKTNGKAFQRLEDGLTLTLYVLLCRSETKEYKVHLANPTEMQQYSGLKYSDDRHDAFWLAEMLRLGILPEGYIYPKEDRPIRDLLRKRSHLVRIRSSLIISLQNIICRNNGFRLKVNDVKALNADRVAPLLEQNQDLALAGKISKESIMLETGPISRFAQVGNYCSYCRKVSSKWISNEKKKAKATGKAAASTSPGHFRRLQRPPGRFSSSLSATVPADTIALLIMPWSLMLLRTLNSELRADFIHSAFRIRHSVFADFYCNLV